MVKRIVCALFIASGAFLAACGSSAAAQHGSAAPQHSGAELISGVDTHKAGNPAPVTLQHQLAALEAAAKETETRLAGDQRDQTRAEERREQARELLAACDALLTGTSDDVKADVFPRVESMSYLWMP